MPTRRTEGLHDTDWITAAKAARALHVHRDTVIRRAAKGEFRMKLIDGTPFVFRRDVEKAAKAAA